MFKLIGFVSAIHSEDPVTLCLFSLWMAQCNITLYIVVFNLDKKKKKKKKKLFASLASTLQLSFILYKHTSQLCLMQRRRYAEEIIFSSSRKANRKAKKEKARRRFWFRPGRCDSWWLAFKRGLPVPAEWKENFRMSKESFEKLCDDLRPFIARKLTRMRIPVSVETQVAATLCYLSDGGRMRKTANAFGLASCTISRIVKRVTTAISTELAGIYMPLPQTENEVRESAANFYKQHGFPQCIGAVDGTHIPIRKPEENASDYINRKGFFSFNVQACVDYKYCFFDVVIKWPGSVHDAWVFGNSKIKGRVQW